MKKITKTIAQIITGAAAAATLWAGRAMATFTVYDGAEAARADGMPTELIGPNGVFTKISNTLLYAIGIVAVVMLVYGGFRYIISGGDSKKVTDAKNTVLYAIIGLVIAFLAFAIVNFVISALPSSTSDKSDNTSLLIDTTHS